MVVPDDVPDRLEGVEEPHEGRVGPAENRGRHLAVNIKPGFSCIVNPLVSKVKK